MENEARPNHRVGFHTIEMLLKLSPENIKQIFIPANRNDARIQNLILLAEEASVSVERKKNFWPKNFLRNFWICQRVK